MTRLTHPPSVPYQAAERDMLNAFLDAMRRVVTQKVEGLSNEQARVDATASALSLVAIVKHLAYAECLWFRRNFVGEVVDDPRLADLEGQFATKPEDTLDGALALYQEQCERSRAIVADAKSLDDVAAVQRSGLDISLRWILVHMIEETARHAGHADIIRETVDGATGE